ncbi:hypothetical protein M0813_07082 [Anaeramoeba flamelloides]|uniref:RRM domain-containing protein n=1 Tax=Anaeramoeba flamelloides TaxID=1746091 RepID=A0ABQ8XBQ9_9EUKA|nr:hypothetical protein M0813_07082 [Anaeramoeba flamelloides]
MEFEDLTNLQKIGKTFQSNFFKLIRNDNEIQKKNLRKEQKNVKEDQNKSTEKGKQQEQEQEREKEKEKEKEKVQVQEQEQEQEKEKEKEKEIPEENSASNIYTEQSKLIIELTNSKNKSNFNGKAIFKRLKIDPDRVIKRIDVSCQETINNGFLIFLTYLVVPFFKSRSQTTTEQNKNRRKKRTKEYYKKRKEEEKKIDKKMLQVEVLKYYRTFVLEPLPESKRFFIRLDQLQSVKASVEEIMKYGGNRLKRIMTEKEKEKEKEKETGNQVETRNNSNKNKNKNNKAQNSKTSTKGNGKKSMSQLIQDRNFSNKNKKKKTLKVTNTKPVQREVKTKPTPKTRNTSQNQRYSQPRNFKKKTQSVERDPKKTVFVGGLDLQTTNQELKKTMEQFGAVDRAITPKFETFGFVQFNSITEAKKAIMNRKTILIRKKKIFIREYRERK